MLKPQSQTMIKWRNFMTEIRPLSVSSDEIKKMLSDSGITTIDNLVEAIEAAAQKNNGSASIGVIQPLASWVLKFFRLD
jgi:hypothetical protein